MVVKACPRCAYQVSDDETSCCRCGLANPAIEAALKPQGLSATIKKVLLGIFFAWIFLGGVLAAAEELWRRPACWNDSKKCADNAELVMWHRTKNLTSLPSKCQTAAESHRFGKPDLPWGAFRQALPGDWYVKTDNVELVEREVRFPNIYGTMERRIAHCYIDLSTYFVTFKLEP